MKRRQIVEAGQIVRLHEGTREGCFAPIRNGQILRHDGILSRYQVALRREGGPRSAAKWRPRHALCAFSRSASRAGVFVPRTGARRSSPGSLHRGRWPGCSSFGGWGRCGLLFSAPPMCRAGWSRSPGGWCRGWLLSGGDLNPPGPIGPPPASGGLAPPMRRRRCRGGNAGRSTHRTGGHTSLRFRARWCWPCCRFFGVRPTGGAHTEKSNPVRPLGYPPGRRRPGGHAAGSTDAPAPIPPPFPRGERGRGITDPLRRGRGFLPSYRCLLLGRPPPHRPSDALGIQGGVGWAVGAGARRAGRPGSRRGRKAPGRLPGRLLLWAPAPSRLTSCRQCGKMPHEGSHRQHSQRCLAHGATKSPVVSRRPGFFCCVSRPWSRRGSTLILGTPPFRGNTAMVPWPRQARQPTIMRLHMRRRATVIFLFVLGFQLRSSHRINHRHGRAAMVHRLPHALDIPISPQQLDRVHLPEAMRRDILRQPKRLRRAFHVAPDGLSRPVLPVIPARKHPLSTTRLRTHLRNQPVRQIHTPPLSRLLLHDPKLPRDLLRTQLQNVADSQTGM